MATPKAGYFLSDGSKVPGTTTVIGRFKDSGGLLFWAFEQGKLAQQGKIQKLYDKAEEAADIGTMAHSMVETFINGDDPYKVLEGVNPEHAAKATLAFNNFLNWQKQTNIKIISKYQEILMVSEQYRYGGTPDAIGELDGKLILLDWKTSNAVYQDYLIQLAAYKNLWDENHDRKIDGGMYLCRFAKEFPDFSSHYYAELDKAWEQFKLFRAAYEIDKELKRRAA
jgi:hypothetical protein